jgi:hypothetical protein
MEIAETIEQMQARLAQVRHTLGVIAEEIADGDGKRAHEVAQLAEEQAGLTAALTRAEEDAEGVRARRAQDARAKARVDLDKLIITIGEHRSKFLEAYRAASVELGLYFRALEEAGPLVRACSSSLGPMPQDLSALRDLALGNLPAESLNGLKPDTGANWKTSFPVVPMYPRLETR